MKETRSENKKQEYGVKNKRTRENTKDGVEKKDRAGDKEEGREGEVSMKRI